ncbi:DUF4291 family protein [Nostoc sp.]|uniref:DUF4291 family protein n=1 Tax=Nostoc sp. TaxID=1180 RepID=UPI002FF9FAF3
MQLGLGGQVLAAYAKDWIVNIEDISNFIQKQRQNIKSECAELITPRETVYSVFDRETQAKLGLSAWTE